MTIVVLGISVSSRNQGVQALGASLANLCACTMDGVEMKLLTGHSQPTTTVYRIAEGGLRVSVVNCRLSPRSRLREHLAWIVFMAFIYRCLPFSELRRAIARYTPWIDTLESCEMAGNVNGGDSFSDIYGMTRFVSGFLMSWTVVLVKGQMVQFPQTFGPFNSRMARWMARYLLLRSSVVVARDKVSQKVAQDLIGSGSSVILSPDVAFSLAAVHPGHVALDPSDGESSTAGVIGINVNGLMYRGGYTRNNMFGLKMDYPGFLRALLCALAQEHAGDIWLVPHTYATAGDVEDDRAASHELRSILPYELQPRIRIVDKEYDPHEVKGVIGTCDFFIGSRMHSCIAALSQGVPCAGVAYSMKFRGVFESVGMEDWVVDGREVEEHEAVRRVLALYRMRDGVREVLRANADAARKRLHEVFREILRPEHSGHVGH